MVKSAKDMKENVRVAMRGGDGQVVCKDFLDKGEYDGKARLFSTLTMEPGCSIGKHVHENEEEIFYILAGQACIDDNGTEVIASVGDSVITRSGEGHSVACEGTDTLEILACIVRYVNE